MTVTLQPQTETKLLALAQQRGQGAEAVIDAALETLLQQDQRAAAKAQDSDAEQTKLRAAFAVMRNRALALEVASAPDNAGRPAEEIAFGDAIAEKFRQQGFQL